MKKKKNKILAFICTLAIVFCGVFGLNLINNVDDVSANAAETEITDLTGTRWFFNETIDFSLVNKSYYYFSCRTDGSTELFRGLYLSSSSLTLAYYTTANLTVFTNGAWKDNVLYRYIDILDGTDVTNSSVIGFFKKNAQYLGRIGDSSDSSSDPVDPPEDSSSSSSDPVDPTPEPDLDSLAPRYGIFANMRMDIIAFDDLGHSVEMTGCVCDFFYHGFSINSEMYEKILIVWDAYQYGSSIDFFHVRIAFDMPVSIDSLVSLSYTGISENEIEDGRWFGLATGFNTDTMENITTLPWKYRSTDDGSKDWYLSVGVNEIVYKNYVGLIIPQISFDDFFKFSVFLPVDAYMSGYNEGFSDGQNEGFSSGQEIGYDEGYEDGREQGYDNGYKFGYAEGFSKAESQDPYGFITWAYGLLDMPGRIISNALNFEFMGVNLLGFATFILSLILTVFVISKLK